MGEDGHAELNGIRDNEYRSLIPNRCLKGDVINAFLQAISHNQDDIYVFNSHVYDALESGTSSIHLNPDNYEPILTKRLLIMPIHHRAGNHWSVVVVYLQRKQIHHLDSFHIVNAEVMSTVFCFMKHILYSVRNEETTKGDWFFIARTDIVKQEGVVDCRVQVCINTLNIVNNSSLHLSPQDCLDARYYIAATIITSTPRVELKKNKNRKETKSIIVDVDVIREMDISSTEVLLEEQPTELREEQPMEKLEEQQIEPREEEQPMEKLVEQSEDQPEDQPDEKPAKRQIKRKLPCSQPSCTCKI